MKPKSKTKRVTKKKNKAPTKPKRKRVVVSIDKKLEAIQRLDRGETLQKVASSYNVSSNTVGDWRRDRKKIEGFVIKSAVVGSDRKTMKFSSFPKTNEAVYLWFYSQRTRGLPTSGPIIKEKAILFSKNFPDEEKKFTASEGWLSRWKTFYGIRQLNVCGEKLSADEISATLFCDELGDLIYDGGYCMDQIFNADETGLNYKMLPDKTLASKSEKEAPGAKMSKERVTVMTCANASGSFRLPLMIIGKSAKPRALQHMDFNSLPVFYKNQKSAWMDAQLFETWFFQQFVPLVKKFLKESDLPQKAILLVDNAPSHPSIHSLESQGITVKFLPPNTTSVIQPMDQGIIVSFKRHYRKNLLQEILLNSDENDVNLTNCLKKINMKDVIFWAAEAWNAVTVSCLRKAWCPLLDITYKNEPTEKKPPELEKFLKKIPGCSDVTSEDVENWIIDDEDHAVTSDQEIVAAVLAPENDSPEDLPENELNISFDEAYSALQTSLNFIERQPDVTAQEILIFRKWRDVAALKRISSRKQKSITDFFFKKSKFLFLCFFFF